MFGKRIAVFALIGTLAASPALAGCIGESTAAMEVYKKEGIARMEDGDYEGAVESFQTALDQSVGVIDAEEIDLSYYKALALYLSGDADAALEVYTSLIDYDDKNWETYYLRGNLYLKTGEDSAALKDYAEALSRDENDTELCLHICADLIDAGLQDEVDPYLGGALLAEPQSAEDYYDLGLIFSMTGDPDSAESCLQQALELGQDEAALLLAGIYEDRGDEESSSSMYSAYLEQHPDDPQVLALLGERALEAGDYETAISYLRLARQDAEEEELTAIVTDLVAAYEYSGDFEGAWEVAAAYLADHSDEALEREYTFLSTRVGAADTADEQPAGEENAPNDEGESESVDGEEQDIEGYGNESDSEDNQ